jgi:hypothetical protein
MVTGFKSTLWFDLLCIAMLLIGAAIVIAPADGAVVWAAGAKGAKGQPAAKTPPPTGSGAAEEDDISGIEKVDLGTRDVLDRLKLLRVQMALDREEIAALDLRIEKIKREREFEELLGKGTGTKTTTRRENPARDILVKSVTLAPRKEAVIMYRGRIFTVRPGDRIGGMVIKDITESGLEVRGGRGSSTVR